MSFRHHSMTLAKKPLVRTLAVIIGFGAALPASAESETEAIQRELADQRQLIQRLQSQQDSQKKAVSSGLPQGISLYGVLDGGIEHISNVKNGSAAGSVTRMPGITGTVASRLGFRAAKELWPGVKGIATLETGFNVDNGTLGQSGRIFGRQLFAGVDTSYGTFTFGRQYSMLVYAMDSDLLGPNIYALGSLDAYLPNARYDNSLAWRGKFSQLTLGATYSLARDSAGGAPGSGTCAGEAAGTAAKGCRGWSAMVKYDAERFGFAAALDEQNGGTGATANFFNGAAPLAFTRPEDRDRRSHLGAYAKLGTSGKVGLGWLGRKADLASGTISSDAYYLEGAWQLNEKIALDGGYHRITNKDQDRQANLYVLRGFYHVDKDFSPYLQVAQIDNSANAQYAVSVGPGVAPPAGGAQTATMIGLRYRF